MAYPLVAAGRTPFPPGTTVEHLMRNLRFDFHSSIFDQFQQHRLYSKMDFEARSGRGRPFGGDFEQLSICKRKKHMFPIARLASGLPSPRLHAVPPIPQGPQWSILPGTQELIFIAFYSINFNSTALFKIRFGARSGREPIWW